MKTTDLMDKYEDELTIANVATFRWFGQKTEFGGQIVTVRCHEDNTKAKALLETNGRGKVLVVDGGASYGRALMGDNVAAIAMQNQWEGVVINGYIRDSADIMPMQVGVMALGATPRRPKKADGGEVGIPLEFAAVVFRPGEYLYADVDGLLLSTHELHL